MQIADLSRIDRTIEVDATPERVFRALTDPAELTAWFRIHIEGTVAQGEEIWMWSAHPEHSAQRFRVKIVEQTRPRRVVWQWHPGEHVPEVDYSHERMTTVTFELTPKGNGTVITVSETGFDEISLDRRARVYRENSTGWDEVVGWLRTYVETKG